MITQTTQTQIPANGSLLTSNFFKTSCLFSGDQTFTVTVKLRDRAGNVGEPSSPASFTIRQCIICMPEGGSMVFPLHAEPQNITNPQSFGTYGGTNTGHSGNDYSILPSGDGQPIYASHVGKIVEMKTTQDDDYKTTHRGCPAKPIKSASG